MADEDALMKAAKNKGRSASVCFSTSRIPGVNLVDAAGLSPPGTASSRSGSKPTRRPASRSQSARITGAKAIRRRPPLSDYGEVPDSPLSLKGADLSDPKLYETGSGTSSPISFRRKGSSRRMNSVHHSQSQRKSTPFLDIPKSPSNAAKNQDADENSYRLRSFSFTTKGLVNRGDSFRRRHHRSNSVHPSGGDGGGGGGGGGGGEEDDNLLNKKQKEALEQLAQQRQDAVANTLDSSCSNLTTYNVSVIGATGVGKSSLLRQFMTSECINPYDRDRDGPSQQTVPIVLNGEESELCFHELKSQKAFQKKHTFDAFLVIYSVVDKSTFQQAEIELTRLHDSNMLHTRPAILVGNKIDLARSRSVSTQDGKCLACTFRVKYVEISVDINHNVDQLLVGLLQQIRLKKQNAAEQEGAGHQWYKSRGVVRASMKARQMFTWIFGREDSKFKNCENLHVL